MTSTDDRIPGLYFEVPGRPQGKARPRFAHGHVYTPQATHEYERLIAACARKELRKEEARKNGYRRTGQKVLEVYAYFPIPKSWPKWRREQAERGEIAPTCKPDADNIEKVVADALNGIAYGDDCKVPDMVARKRFQTGKQDKYPHGYLLVMVVDFPQVILN